VEKQVKATTFVVRELPYLFEGGALLWLVERYLAEQGCLDLLKGKCPYTKGFQELAGSMALILQFGKSIFA
jgi:hypothetical protein